MKIFQEFLLNKINEYLKSKVFSFLAFNNKKEIFNK